jgi:hypothetical protein
MRDTGVRGNNQIHTTSGVDMNISCIGHWIVKTPIHNLMLKMFPML